MATVFSQLLSDSLHFIPRQWITWVNFRMCVVWTFAMRVTVLCLLQHSGRFYEELPNTADYVSYRLACNKDDYPEPYSPPINPPLSFLPQHPYHSQPTTVTGSSSTTTPSKNTYSPPSHTTAVFKYPSVQGLSSPPPGMAAYTFPKEQYVWALEKNKQIKPHLNPNPFLWGWCRTVDYQAASLHYGWLCRSMRTLQQLFLEFS